MYLIHFQNIHAFTYQKTLRDEINCKNSYETLYLTDSGDTNITEDTGSTSCTDDKFCVDKKKKMRKRKKRTYLQAMMMMMMNCFCGMVNRRKALSLISSRDHCQRSSPSLISDTLRAGFEPPQSLSSGFLE